MKFYLQFNQPKGETYLPAKYLKYTKKLTLKQNQFINFFEPTIRIICCNCKRDISNILSLIILYEKDIKNLLQEDLCVNCFYQIVFQNETCKKGKYYVRTKNIYSLTDSNWKISDQILFIRAFIKLGLNNQNILFLYLTLHKCLYQKSTFQNHLIDTLMIKDSDNYCLSQGFIKSYNQKYHWNFLKWIKLIKKNYQKKQKIRHENLQSFSSNFGKFSRLNSQGLESNIQQNSFINNKQIKANNSFKTNEESYKSSSDESQPIYRSQRQQFLVQNDPFAQSILAYLQYRQDDTPQEVKCKDKILIQYNQKLLERRKIKKFIIQRQLLTNFSTTKNSKRQKSFNYFNSFSLLESVTDNQSLSKLQQFNRFFDTKEEKQKCQKLMIQERNLQTLIKSLKFVKKTSQKSKNQISQINQYINQNKQINKQKNKNNINLFNKDLKARQIIFKQKIKYLKFQTKNKLNFIQKNLKQIQISSKNNNFINLKFQ